MSYAGAAAVALRELTKARGTGNSLARSDPLAQPEGIVKHPGQLELPAATALLAKDIGAILSRHFPGFRWALQCNQVGGVFDLYCLDFSARWCYTMCFGDVMNDPRRRIVVRAAREMLHRFGWSGTRFDAAQLAAMPRGPDGEIPPLTDGLPRNRATLAATLERKLATGQARVVGLKDGGRIVEVLK